MRLRQVKVDATSDLRKRAAEAAWMKRTTVSGLVKDGLRAYVDDPAARARLLRTDTPGTETRISFRIDEELWDAAIDRSGMEGDSVASVVRRILEDACASAGVTSTKERTP